MKNLKAILIVATVVLVLTGVIFIVLSGGEDPLTSNKSTPGDNSNSSSVSENPTQAEAPKDVQTVNPQGYQDYSAETVTQTDGKKILFFHASWCPTCRALDQNIRAGIIPAELTIFKVNYDTEKDLVRRYGVTYQHTLVQIDNEGNELNNWFGSYTIQQLVDELI